MTLTWMDHVVTKILDLLMISLFPLLVWFFRNHIKAWFKNDTKKTKKKDFKPDALGL